MTRTVEVDDDMLRRASEASGIADDQELVRRGLESLIARNAAERLSRKSGTQPTVEVPRRRRLGDEDDR